MAAAAMPSDIVPRWRRYLCRACGYIYDEELGDPDGGLAPGTRYEDIPDDWACPLCGVSKADFDIHDGPSQRAATPAETIAPRSGSRTRRGVVIVGGGQAGWSTARAIRLRDAEIPITLLAADAADVYSKPALSLAFGQRRRRSDLVASPAAAIALDARVRLVPFAAAIGIDASRKRIRTTRGSFSYDALVLATGARPIDHPALPSATCWRINSLESWSRLEATLAAGPADIVVIGAGLVGCEFADDLAHAGHRVTVLDPAPRPLAAWASDAEASQLLEAWHRLGVTFHGGIQVAGVDRTAAAPDAPYPGHRVRSTDGRTFDGDVVIAAIGLDLDPRLAKSAGLAIDHGIAVDPVQYRTSDPSIYATGDCISIDGRPCRFVEPLDRQADAIARAVLGHESDVDAKHRNPIVRLKTRSARLTLNAQRRSNS